MEDIAKIILASAVLFVFLIFIAAVIMGIYYELQNGKKKTE
jgi:uncharacterized protein HemY